MIEACPTGARKPLLLPAMIGVGFVGGLISGPYFLLDLDVDVYHVSPAGRVYCWAFLCAIGTGLLACVILTLTERWGKPGSAARRGATWGFKRLLAMAASVRFPQSSSGAMPFHLGRRRYGLDVSIISG